MSYHHTGQLLDILSSAPRFDGAVLQSHYEDIPVRLLDLLQEKTAALTVDGHSLSGVDVDRIGTDWEDALDMALQHLTDLGHCRIGLVSLQIDGAADPQRPTGVRPRQPAVQAPSLHLHPARPARERAQHPTRMSTDRSRRRCRRCAHLSAVCRSRPSFMVGISDTIGVAAALQRLGIAVPDDLSVYILGHHDVPTEHLGLSSPSPAVRTVMPRSSSWRRCATALAKPDLPPQVVYLQCRESVRESTAAPAPAMMEGRRTSS